MRAKQIATLFILFVLLGGALPVLGAAKAQMADVDKIVTAMMQLYDIPGVSLALVKDGKVLYTQGYGKANTVTGAAVTENTVFEIGSVTKSMTTTDIMQLVEEGKVDLDAPVATYLPGLKLSDPEATQHITVQQIITNSSGLPRADQGWYSGKLTTTQQVLDDLVNVPLTAAPGKLWQYCNQNFVIAGAIIEKVTGQTWEDYTRQHIFEPLGMKSASFNIDGIQGSPNPSLPANRPKRKLAGGMPCACWEAGWPGRFCCPWVVVRPTALARHRSIHLISKRSTFPSSSPTAFAVVWPSG